MDLESRRRWEEYTKAKEVMLERTHIAEAPWWVVQAVDKKRARLNCIHHLLALRGLEFVRPSPIKGSQQQRSLTWVFSPFKSSPRRHCSSRICLSSSATAWSRVDNTQHDSDIRHIHIKRYGEVGTLYP
jgi:hypothetical protein